MSQKDFTPQPHRHLGPVAGCKECERESFQFDKQEKSPMIQTALDRLHDKIGLRDDLEDLKALLLEYAKACERIEQLERERAARTLELAALRKVNAALSAPSARGDSAADFAAQLAALRSYEALQWAATWVEESGQHNEAVRSFAKNMAMTIRAEANSRHPYVGEKK